MQSFAVVAVVHLVELDDGVEVAGSELQWVHSCADTCLRNLMHVRRLIEISCIEICVCRRVSGVVINS